MTVTRRRFLQVTALAGGGFALGIGLPPLSRALAAGAEGATGAAGAGAAEGAALTAFLRIHADGRIVFVSPNIEMGQGVFTSHSMVVAEELDADLDRFEAVHSPVDEAYNNPMFGVMGTGGSTSTPAFWMPLRKAGAAARAMLLAAAAERWGVPVARLATERGRVVGPDGRSAAYGELAADAARQTPPEDPPLKDPKAFRIVGRSTKRLEGPSKVTGAATFGIDLQLPDLRTAVIARPPVWGGAPGAIRNRAEVERMHGVRKVKPVSAGVAVIADGYWPAYRASRALDVDWQPGPQPDLSTEVLFERFAELAKTPGAQAELHGEPDARLDGSGDGSGDGGGDVVEATFRLPYLAHAPMEPLNATARVDDDGAEIWAGTYFQTVDRQNLADLLGLEPERVTLHTLLAGGAFGRRAVPDSDFLVQAAEVARGEGVPVKLIWTREDDTRGGRYRGLAVHRLEAKLGGDGLPDAWRQRVVTQSIMTGTPFEEFMVRDGVDHTSVEGATEMPYRVPHRRVELHSPEVPVSVLWWRSVGHTHTAFAGEHFLDILARKAGRDPLEYRRALLGKDGDPRLRRVLDLAAEKSGWGRPLPSGRARGLALKKSFSSYVCQVFECSLGEDGVPVTHRVTCAVDVGTPINPWNIEQQVQGAVAYALTAALYGEIALEKGRVVQGNFDDYRIVRMHELPPIDVHVVPGDASPTGIGEPGVPPVAPALANAKLALTGEPTYRLPFARAAREA